MRQWRAYAQISPLEPDRSDFRFAHVLQTLIGFFAKGSPPALSDLTVQKIFYKIYDDKHEEKPSLSDKAKSMFRRIRKRQE